MFLFLAQAWSRETHCMEGVMLVKRRSCIIKRNTALTPQTGSSQQAWCVPKRGRHRLFQLGNYHKGWNLKQNWLMQEHISRECDSSSCFAGKRGFYFFFRQGWVFVCLLLLLLRRPVNLTEPIISLLPRAGNRCAACLCVWVLVCESTSASHADSNERCF